MKLFSSLAALLICSAAGLSSATQADDILQIVPHDALAAVVLPHPQQSQNQLTALATEMQLPLPDLVQLAVLQSGFAGSIDPSGPMAVIIGEPVPGSRSPASIVYCVTAHDHEKLLKQVNADTANPKIAAAVVNGRRLLISRKAGYTLIAADQFRSRLEQVLDSERNVAETTPNLQSRRNDMDVYAAISDPGIDWLQQRFLEGVAVMKQQVAQQQPDNSSVAAAFEMYEQLAQEIPERFSDALIGFSVNDQGLRFIKSASWTAGKAFAGTATTRDELVSQLQTADLQNMVAAFAGSMPEEFSKAIMDFSIEASTTYLGEAGGNEDYVRALQEFSQQWIDGIENMSMVMGVPAPGKSLYEKTSFTLKVADPQTFLTEYEKTIKKLEQVSADQTTPINYSLSRTQENGVDVLAVDTDLSQLMQNQAVPGSAQMMRLLFGEDNKLTIYLTATEDKVIGQYVSKDRLLQQVKSDRTSTLPASLQTTVALLPEDAEMVAFWSLNGTLQLAQNFMQAAQPQAAPLPDMPAGPPAGMSVSMNRKRLDMDAVLPKQTLQNIARFVRGMQSRQRQR